MSLSARFGTPWRKVIGDLLASRGRSILVALSIALGAASIGTMLGARDLVVNTITSGNASVAPANATLFALPLGAELVDRARATTGVRDAQARGVFTVRLQVTEDEWRDLRLYVLPDEALRINVVRAQAGAWPAATGEVSLERSSLTYLKRQIGDLLLMETPDGSRIQMRIAGTAYDLNQPPVTGTGQPLGYITPATLAGFGAAAQSHLDQLDLLVSERADDQEHVRSVATTVHQAIEAGGGHVVDTYVPEPGKHPSYDGSQTMLVLLAIIGAVMVFMAAFLVANTIAALLMNQVRQIGVMKSLGASSHQMIVMYLATVLALGFVALIVAVPVSLVGAWGLAAYALGVVNFDPPAPALSAGVIGLMLVAALGVPVAAAAIPIRAAMRMSVREAITSSPGAGHFGASWIDRALERVRGLPRPTMLALANTFRRKGRLWLTLATLVLAGSVFIGVLAVRAALLGSVDDEFRYMAYDAQVSLAQPAPADQLESTARGVAGVTDAEAWIARSTYRIRPDGSASETIALIAPRPDTRMIEPVLLEGRWLAANDADAVVITSDLVQSEPDLHVGGDLVLQSTGQSVRWRIVGLVKTYRFDRQVGPSVFVEREAALRALAANGADTLQVRTDRHNASRQARVASAVSSALEAAGYAPRTTATGSARRALRDDVAGIILTFLVLMAMMLAVVGGLGLAGTMSMNVLERTREIGVMRAIGATDRDLLRIVLVEGIVIALLAWVLGAALSMPVTGVLYGVVGQIFVHQPLSGAVFAPLSAALWLVLVLALALVSTWLPAQRASHVTVRQALAYE